MDPISTLNQVMLLLRQQLAQKSERRERVPQRRQASGPSANITAQEGELGQTENAIRSQIHTLRLAGVTDERQLFRVAIEGLLLYEFGTEVGNDPAFQQIRDRVCSCLEEEPRTFQMLRHLLLDGKHS
ncbi:hypothetical protein AX768_02460 [Burkholderia sp. PAMC 28687]|nr:hypothetical protein AX768_02460 [Burkholderia sp. PAMC 28687]